MGLIRYKNRGQVVAYRFGHFTYCRTRHELGWLSDTKRGGTIKPLLRLSRD